MKRLYFLLLAIGLLFAGCSKVYIDPNLATANLSDAEQAFIVKFENYVLQHKKNKILDLLEPQYRKEQFEDFYHSDSRNFFSEFFCGKSGNDFMCFPLRKVTGIELIKYERNGDLLYLTFKVYAGNKYIIVEDLQIKKYHTQLGQERLGIIGSFG